MRTFSQWPSFLNSMLIAMEADDITGQTANEVRSALGGATPSTTQDDERGEDLMQVDNIFTHAPGTDDNGSDPSPSGNPEEDQAAGAEPMNPDGSTPNADNEENPEEGNGEQPAEDPNLSNDQGDPNLQQDNPTMSSEDLLFAKKNKVRDNMVQLYSIISNDIKSLVESLSSVDDENSVHVINAVLGHLRNCKDFLFKTLTVNLKELEYDELLERYVTIKRVYDVCVKMMGTHFTSNKDDSKDANKK